jgi:hypothetical protein
VNIIYKSQKGVKGMFPSRRIQRKMMMYAAVFKSMGIIDEQEMKKINFPSPKKDEIS